MQQGFLCAYGAAEPVNAERLDFEQGFMLRLDNHPDEVYIYYNGQNRWEVVRGDWSQDDSTTAPDIVPGPDFYVPIGVFAIVWSDEQVQRNLGFALAPEPLNFPGKIQVFPGGTLIYNFLDGQVRAFFTER